VLAEPTVLIPVNVKISNPVDVETPERALESDPPDHLIVLETPFRFTAVQVLAVPV
jgi:hypothetical protein